MEADVMLLLPRYPSLSADLPVTAEGRKEKMRCLLKKKMMKGNA